MRNKHKRKWEIHKNKDETLNKKGAAPFEQFFPLQAVYWLGLRSDKVTGKAPMRSHNRTEEKGCTEKTS